MSGSQIGGTIGFVVGNLIAPGIGGSIGFAIGSALGGAVAPERIKGPRLKDAEGQTAQEGMFIPFGYGTYPVPCQLIWQGIVNEHENEEGGKGGGGVENVTYSYTRSYAIACGEGEGDVVMLWRNGKLVYDITADSTIQAQNSKWLAKCTFYRGTETQLVDPVIEAQAGVGNTGPMRGLIYFVLDEDETAKGEVAQYRAVVAKAGTITDTQSTEIRFLRSVDINQFYTTARDAVTWTSRMAGTGIALRYMGVGGSKVVASSYTGALYYSSDSGVTWATNDSTARNIVDIAYGNGKFVAVSDGWTLVTVDDGLNWTEYASPGAGGTEIAFGKGFFVAGLNGKVYRSADGQNWTEVLAFGALAVAFNGEHFMVVGNSGASYSSPDGTTWTYGSAPGGVAYSFTQLCGRNGYFLALGNANVGICRSTDLGVTWTEVLAVVNGSWICTSSVDGDLACTGSGINYVSTDDGVTWSSPSTGPSSPVDMKGIIASADWYPAPDAPGVYVNEDGNEITTYTAGTSISDSTVNVADIIADLCDRVGVAAAELDVSTIADTIAGYPCTTEASAQAFIEPLMQYAFFDRGEWDKKLRFIPRGGASAFALTMEDVLASDDGGPPVKITRMQEPELPRKTTVITIDPAAEYSPKPQFWERTVATVNAKSEPTFELNVVCDADTGKQIAHKRSNIAWSELLKFEIPLSLKWSKLTATDVGTFADSKGVVHRIRINGVSEELGEFRITEAMLDRANCYVSAAVGTVAPTPTTTAAGIIGPTRFVAMNLPQMRAQDNSPGMWVGACGMTSGWTGCKILLSVDAGVSYFTALTITEPTTMGDVTAAFTAGGTPLSVHVFGGTLSSKTTAQVTAGANYSAVLSGATAEVLAYETATVGAAGYYDLTVLTDDLKGTTAANHVAGDAFMDMASAYFVPIDQSYAGQTLYFKAVGIGVSADAVDAVAYVFDGSTYVIDGGGA